MIDGGLLTREAGFERDTIVEIMRGLFATEYGEWESLDYAIDEIASIRPLTGSMSIQTLGGGQFRLF